MWGRCLYDTTTTPPTVVDVVAHAPPHRLAHRRTPGKRPLPRRPGLRGPPLRARSAGRLHAGGRAGQPARRRRPARLGADRPREPGTAANPSPAADTGAGRGVAWSGRHAVVTMPAEVDMTNATDVSDLLIAVAGESPEVITADIAATVFCDSAGVRALVRAHERADAGGSELRLALGDSPTAVSFSSPAWTRSSRSTAASSSRWPLPGTGHPQGEESGVSSVMSPCSWIQASMLTQVWLSHLGRGGPPGAPRRYRPGAAAGHSASQPRRRPARLAHSDSGRLAL